MNTGTMVVLIIVAAVIGAIIRKLVKDRREGKHSCSCGCEGCAMKASCHKSKETE